MYYSEQLQSPISEYFAHTFYGINPAAPEAVALGFYPLTEAPEGYTASGYRKVGDHYEAIPLPITNGELAAVYKLRKAGGVEAAARRLIPQWVDTSIYQPGDLVEHKGAVYRKADDTDNTEPDDVAGGWLLVT